MTPQEARRDHVQMLRFMLFHAGIGSVIGMVTASAIILMDIGGFGTRIENAANPLIPILLVVVPFASIFGGAAAASAILLLPYERRFKSPQPPLEPDL
ncbi:MAG: hypothetical protein KF874_11945 [Rhizobiaceae bacterium]|nr:hypothetical protein [Rhizobiaceae bacterium]